MKTGFVTDSFSTLGGLASVAYGDVDYFRDVQNQIYSLSPTRAFDTLLPSATLESFFGVWQTLQSIILDRLDEEYEKDGEFRDYVDIYIGPNWRNVIPPKITIELQFTLDNLSTYESTFTGYLKTTLSRVADELFKDEELLEEVKESTLEIIEEAVKDSIQRDERVAKDFPTVMQIVANNPRTKLSVPPPNAIIPLNRNIDLALDSRGVSFDTGYLSPRQYYDGYAYPNYRDDAIVPPTLRDSVKDGYVGYPRIAPINGEPISNYGTPAGTTSDNTVLGAIENLNPLAQSDRDVFEISLIGPRMNGMLDFNPSTMSNGDLFDKSLIPDFEEQNKDKEKGAPSIARNFDPAY